MTQPEQARTHKRAPASRAARPVSTIEPDSTEQDEPASTEHQLAVLVTRELHTPGINTEKIKALADVVEHQLAGMVTDEQHRQTLYTAAAATIVSYVEQCMSTASIEALATITRRTRARMITELKKHRSVCVRSLLSLVTSLDKQHKLHIPMFNKETAKQAIERQADELADYLLNRLVEDEQDEHQGVSTEPVNILIRRKAAALREYGYVLSEDGLYSTRFVDEQEVLTLIAKMFVDVTSKRHIYSTPDVVTERPKEQGVVVVTQVAPLKNRKAAQTLEIHRSDMLARQPKFLEQIHAVKPPHKKQLGNFIDALEAMAMVAPIERRFNATGLVCHDDTFVFLHASGGGLTADGIDEQYKVQFPMSVTSRLTSIKYGWQRPSTPDEQVTDYRVLLQVLGIAPGSRGYGDVLLGAHGFAPMSQLCDTGGVWTIIHGLTGSMKSATSRLPLQGYARGYYGRQETSTINLREGASTPYAIEQVLYYLAGMFAHLDDGLKGNNVPQKDIEKFYKMLSTVGGHAVTKQGGKRGLWGQGEGGFGIEPYPRGSGVYTVETLPASEGHASDLARYIVVSLDGAACVDTVLLDVLQSQDAAASMNRATCSYIQWLLPRMADELATIPDKELVYREQGVHTRTPTSYAKLETGIAALLEYGVSIGAHSEQDAASMLEDSRARLVHVALKQKALMGIDEQTAQANDTVTVFYKMLHEAMRAPAHKLYVTDATYRPIDSYSSDGDIDRTIAHRPQPPLFLSDESIEHELNSIPDNYGWKYNEHGQVYEPLGVEAGVLKWDGVKPVLLMYISDFKDTVYKEIDKLAKAQDIPLPGSNDMVSKLKEKGKLTRIESTSLHGRSSKKRGGVYVLDMTPAPDSTEQDEHQDETELYDYTAEIFGEE